LELAWSGKTLLKEKHLGFKEMTVSFEKPMAV
jgi:hypothetical protein